MKETREMLGSVLSIEIFSDAEISDFESCFSLVSDFESKYSRFIEGNFLSELNNSKNSEIDSEFFSIVQLCLQVSELSQGYFDITVLPLLENAGYGISKNKLKEDLGYKNIRLSRGNISLENNICIELGSIGKGYMLDKVYAFLEKKYNDFVIDFGGDIKVKGSHVISLENPTNISKTLGSIVLSDASIASSSGNRRKFGDSHHLLNAKNGKAISEVTGVFVSHKLAIFSDVFSTALFVSPKEISIDILNTISDLEGMLLFDNGDVYKTKNFIKI